MGTSHWLCHVDTYSVKSAYWLAQSLHQSKSNKSRVKNTEIRVSNHKSNALNARRFTQFTLQDYPLSTLSSLISLKSEDPRVIDKEQQMMPANISDRILSHRSRRALLRMLWTWQPLNHHSLHISKTTWPATTASTSSRSQQLVWDTQTRKLSFSARVMLHSCAPSVLSSILELAMSSRNLTWPVKR